MRQWYHSIVSVWSKFWNWPGLCIHKVRMKILDYKFDIQIFLMYGGDSKSGPDPNNQNTLKNSLNSCHIFRLLKLFNNISNCIHMKQFKKNFQTSNKLAKPKHQVDNFPTKVIVLKFSDFSWKFLRSWLGPNNKNTLKNSLNSCQIFRLLKLLSYETALKNISWLLIS
jgi:hypothetical protein